MSPASAATLPDDWRPLFERLQSWRETSTGRVAWYAIEVGVVTGLYYGAARAGLRLAYPNGSVTAVWPPVGVGIAALVIGGPRLWPGIAVLFLRLVGRRPRFERVFDVLALAFAQPSAR